MFNSFSKSSVTGVDVVGGLVGNNQGEVSTCYSIGRVDGTTDVGGLVGSANADSYYPDGIVCYSFWDVNSSGLYTSAGGEGKTTIEMQTKNTFADVDWDFEEVWNIGENQTYPYLMVYPAGDLNYDGIVNLPDFAILADHWLAGVE